MATDLKQFKTIIVVIMENRSFDHVLGYLSRSGGRTDINGIKDDSWIALQENPGTRGSYRPYPLKRMEVPDPPHERDDIAMQIEPTRGSNVWMRGFVQSYARREPAPDDESLVMGFYEAGDVLMMDFLAREFLVCDQWFCSLPTGTQPNRLMAMAGIAARDKNVPVLLADQELVYDWLNRQGVSWRVYHDGPLPFFSLMPRWQGYIADGMLVDLLGIHTTFRRFEKLDRDFTYDPTLPSVIFIEPEYTDGPHRDANHDHPPTSIAVGQTFLHSIYRTLLRRPDRWAKTLLVITYDEHGGFFDHERPYGLTTNAPPGFAYEPFRTTGVRVPTLLVSPFVKRGAVLSEPLDHTSLLGLMADVFTPGTSYSDAVTRRVPLCDLGRWLKTRDDLTLSEARRDLPLPPPAVSLIPPRVPGSVGRVDLRSDSAAQNAKAFREAAVSMINNHPIAATKLLPASGHFIEAP